MNRKQKTRVYGFGALGVTSVKLTDIQETFSNPNLDNKPFVTHKPLKTANSFNSDKTTLYPNFKYIKSKSRKKKKKSPRKRKLIRPSSAITSKSNNQNEEYIPHYLKNLNSSTNSIQFELMKQHMNDLDELKQEITDQMNRNNNGINNVGINNETNDIQNVPQINIERKKKRKIIKKIFVPSPTTSIVVCVNKEPLNNNHHNNHQPQINTKSSPKSPKQDIDTVNRPKHQSFQNINNINQTPGSGSVSDVVIQNNQKKEWKPVVPKVHTRKRKKTIDPKTPKTPRYNKSIYHSFHDQPVIAQPRINRINVGTDGIPFQKRLSSTFASNTPRIIPLNKLSQNPSYYNSKSKKKVHKRPWSSKPKIKNKKNKKKLHSKKRKNIKKKLERPKSAPSQSVSSQSVSSPTIYQHPSMKSYMENIEKQQTKHAQIEYFVGERKWNPFDGITVFELEYLISFLETKQNEYHIKDETLDILHQCLNFYVGNDSYETAWNAWNIIQKFLLPDTNKIRIDKKLCRKVLHQYQKQSRDLKNNHIEEELFDDIIKSIGNNIAAKIPNKQQFTIQFEEFVIQYQQQTANKNKPKESNKQQRPHSAASISKTAISKTQIDLVHATDRNRPHSALNTSNTDSNLQTIQEETNQIKYSLDGIIDII